MPDSRCRKVCFINSKPYSISLFEAVTSMPKTLSRTKAIASLPIPKASCCVVKPHPPASMSASETGDLERDKPGICWLDAVAGKVNGWLNAVAGEVNCWARVGNGRDELVAGGRRRMLIAWSWLGRRKHRNLWRGERSGLPCQWRVQYHVIVKRWCVWWDWLEGYRNQHFLLYCGDPGFNCIKPVYDLQ